MINGPLNTHLRYGHHSVTISSKYDGLKSQIQHTCTDFHENWFWFCKMKSFQYFLCGKDAEGPQIMVATYENVSGE